MNIEEVIKLIEEKLDKYKFQVNDKNVRYKLFREVNSILAAFIRGNGPIIEMIKPINAEEVPHYLHSFEVKGEGDMIELIPIFRKCR